MSNASRPVFPGSFRAGFVTSVEIGYSENGHVARQTGKGKKLSMEEAESILAYGRRNFRGDLGCDKTDFILTFSDGETYRGCYCLTPRDPITLARHVFDWVAYIAFTATDDILDRAPADAAKYRAECREWLTLAFGV